MRPPLGAPWAGILPWALASIPFLFLVVWFWNRGPGLDADDYALSMIHAEALVEGRPYGDTRQISTPLDIAPPRQPPALPVIIAATMAMTGEFNMGAIKTTMALVAFPFFLLAGLTFARTHGAPAGIAVVLMLTVALAATPPAAATHVQSDLGFAAIVWAVIALLDRPGTITWARVGAVFLLSSLAVSYRYLGVALAPTIALYALAHRERGGLRLAAVPGVWALAGVVGTFIVGWAAVRRQVAFDLGDLYLQVQQLIPYYGRAAVPAHLYPLPWNRANDIYHVLSLGLAAVGLLRWSRTGWKSGAWLFTASYIFTLLIVYNRSARYLIPLYPVVIFGLVYGAEWLVARLRRGWSQARVSLVTASALGSVTLLALGVLVTTEPREGGNLAELPAAQELFAFLASENANSPTRVAFAKPRVLAWAADVPSMVIPFAEAPVLMSDFDEQGITHVVVDRIELEPGRTAAALNTIAAHACRFEQAFDNGSFQVHRILPSCPAPAT